MVTGLALVLALSAFEPQGTSPYEVDYVFDTTLTLGSFSLVFLMHDIAGKSLPNDYICSEMNPTERCDPADLNSMDRGIIGKASKTWGNIGKYSFYGIIAGAAVGAALDNALSPGEGRARGFFADTLIIAESTGLAVMTAHSIRFGIRRPRPTQYEGAADVNMSDVERHLSFPSGHSTTTAAITTSFATTFWLRHPDSPWRWVVAGSSVALATVSGFGRVGAGRHFPSDAIAGQLIGTAFGILVPLAHRADVAVNVNTGDTKMLTVTGAL